MATNACWRSFTCALLLVMSAACERDRGLPPELVEVVGSYEYRVARDPMDDRILSECVVGTGRFLEPARGVTGFRSGAQVTAGGFSRGCLGDDGMAAVRRDTVPTLRFRCADRRQSTAPLARTPLARLREGTLGQLRQGLPRAHTVEFTVPGRPPPSARLEFRFDADSATSWLSARPEPAGAGYIVRIPEAEAAAFQAEALGARRIRVRLSGTGEVHILEFSNHRLRQALQRLHCG